MNQRRRRRGAVIVAALVCLLVVMSMVGAMLLSALRARQQLARQRDLRQCLLLQDAAAALAMERLAHDAEYRGETWIVPADPAAGLAAGRVEITAARQSREQPWQLTVVAEYPVAEYPVAAERPTGDRHSIRRSQTITLTAPTLESE